MLILASLHLEFWNDVKAQVHLNAVIAILSILRKRAGPSIDSFISNLGPLAKLFFRLRDIVFEHMDVCLWIDEQCRRRVLVNFQILTDSSRLPNRHRHPELLIVNEIGLLDSSISIIWNHYYALRKLLFHTVGMENMSYANRRQKILTLVLQCQVDLECPRIKNSVMQLRYLFVDEENGASSAIPDPELRHWRFYLILYDFCFLIIALLYEGTTIQPGLKSQTVGHLSRSLCAIIPDDWISTRHILRAE